MGKLPLGGAIALVVLLSACVESADPEVSNVNSGSVALGSKADVLRELGNITASQDIATLAQTAVSDSPSGGGQGPGKALSSGDCPQGGSYDINAAGIQGEAFDFFDVTPTVGFITVTFFECARNVENRVLTLSGPAEAGATGDSGESDYAYAVLGTGGASLAVVTATGGGASTLVDALIGRAEAFTQGGSLDLRLKVSDHITLTRPGQPDYNAARNVGNADQPFRITDNGLGVRTYDGPFSYASTLCAGGTVAVETLTPLATSGFDAPTAGQLRLTSGESVVTMTFNEDGSATLVFADGSSATLTASEIQAARDASQC
jgi:hypothetical protein